MNFSIGAAITRQQAQNLAIAEAARGAGFVSPNPLVGCVIVDANHCFLASGYHAKYGEDHAEVAALKKINELGLTEQLKSATVYVTLEPCAHHGKTPPCVERLLLEPIKTVVVGCQDPNPLVAGKGLQKLRDKGILVETDPEFSRKCQELTEIFLWHMQNKSPFVSLKIATSMDGQVALKSGESQWITSEASRLEARALRAKYDATLIGARTLTHDNPRLDFRGTSFEGLKNNRIVVWDPTHKAEKFLPSSALLKTHKREQITLVHDAHLTMETLKKLYADGIYSLFVEGGGHTISQFLQKRLFNKIYQFVAPSLIGSGLGWTSSLEVAQLSQKISLSFTEIRPIGEDVLISAKPKSPVDLK